MKENTFQTSKEAYEFCLEKGLISKRVAEVLHVVTFQGPVNQTMAHHAIVKSSGNVALEKYSISPRFAVLERMGLIRDAGRQPCPITGRSTVFFEATCARPLCTEREANSSATRRETIAALRTENRDLRKQVEQLQELMNMRSASHQEREKRLRAAPAEVQTSMF